MSYIETIAQSGNTVTYVGPNDQTILVVPGGIVVRLNAGTPNVLQFSNNTGVPQRFEAYNSVFYSNGLQENFNFNGLPSLGLAYTWINLDGNTMLTDGSDIQHAIVTLQADNDSRQWRITAWRPTPTKVAIVATFDSPDSTVDGTVEGIITESHRITVPDSAANSAVTAFNGQQYRASDGWIPEVAGHFLGGSLYQGHGQTWSIRPTGVWGLFSDASGLSVCNHTLDINFRRYPPSIIRRFGDFS